jgi:hypothetical protein
MCLQEILERAEKYDKAGKKKLAEKWFAYAERYEEIMKRNKETLVNCQKTGGRR